MWLALCFLVFLGLYQVCLKSVFLQYQRQRAEQAVQTGMFSLFSEYEPHLLEDYDLFFFDTSFRTGTEKQDEICSHLWHFVNDNLTDLSGEPLLGLDLTGVNVTDLKRATDAGGMVFFSQAAEVMKEKTGVSLAEEWLLQEENQKTIEENCRIFEEDCETYEGCVVNYEGDEDDEEDGEEPDEEAYEWDGLWNRFVLSMALPEGQETSEKAMDPLSAPSGRTLSTGSGTAAGDEDGLIEKQWFIQYLCEYMTQAQEMLQQPREDGYLDYQLEYIICGASADRENLAQIVQRLLLIREGINYVFLLSHPDYAEQAETLAAILSAVTLNPELKEGIRHLILLGWAYGESVAEVRQLLSGLELSVLKSEQDWQVPLSGLLVMLGDPGRYDDQTTRQQGIGYEAYLRMLLSLQSAETLAMRALDVVEGELQQKDGCSRIHLDHCVESMTAQVWIGDIYLERTSGYE